MANPQSAMESEGFDPEAPRYPALPAIDDEDEWSYVMRRTMQEIIPGLFLGPYASATRSSLDKMQAAGLTHVVCVRSDVEAHLIRANHMNHFQYFLVQMDDSPLESIIPKVKTVASFIDNCLNSGGKVLVHGNAGMSRSSALVIGYIMSKYGVTFKKANKYVHSKRSCIALSDAFRNQLMEYEPIYLAEHAAQMWDRVEVHEVEVDQEDDLAENDPARRRMDGDEAPDANQDDLWRQKILPSYLDLEDFTGVILVVRLEMEPYDRMKSRIDNDQLLDRADRLAVAAERLPPILQEIQGPLIGYAEDRGLLWTVEDAGKTIRVLITNNQHLEDIARMPTVRFID